jgi:hypothetical protein
MFGKFFSGTMGVLVALLFGSMLLCGGCIFTLAAVSTAGDLRRINREIAEKKSRRSSASSKINR